MRDSDDVGSDAFSHHVVGDSDLTVPQCAVGNDGVGHNAFVVASDVCR